MRKMLAMLAAIAMILPATINAQSDEKEKYVGSGNLITREVPVTSFSQLTVGGVFNVVLAQGSAEAVKIEAEDNLQELVLVEQNGNGLTVTMKKHKSIKTNKKMTVYITFKQLNSIDLKTVGNITTTGTLNFDDLKMHNASVGNVELKLAARSIELENKSVGNLELEGKADNAVIKNKSVGSLEAAKFVVQTMHIDNNGVGGAEVNAEKSLKMKSSGIGGVKNRGGGTVTKLNRVVI
ncbi:MAG: head GIN domain-containing protein [Chitinophagaceae bacterium]